MPIIAVLTRGINFTDYKVVIRAAIDEVPGLQKAVPEIALNWGNFVQSTVDFLIVALCIFFVVKIMNKLRKPEPLPPPPNSPSTEQLLAEIRDLLKKN